MRVEPGFGKAKGDTLEFDRISNVVNAGGTISETSVMPETKVTISKGSLTINEYGNSIPWTGKLETLSSFGVSNIWTDALRDDMAKVIDGAVADVFKTAYVKYAPTGTDGTPTGTITTDGTTTTATRVITTFDVKEIVDYMKATLFVPKYDGESYFCVASTAFLRAIKDSDEWEEWNKYVGPEQMAKGEVGRFYEVRFIEETNSLSGVLGATSYKGEAVFFGADPVVEGVAIPEEIRAKIPTDYGRSKGVAWYGLMGWALSWNTGNPGEAKIVHVTGS